MDQLLQDGLQLRSATFQVINNECKALKVIIICVPVTQIVSFHF